MKDKFTLLLGNSVVAGSVSIVKRLKGGGGNSSGGFRVKYSLKDFYGNAGAVQAGADPAENAEKYKPKDCSELGCTLYRPCHHEWSGTVTHLFDVF